MLLSIVVKDLEGAYITTTDLEFEDVTRLGPGNVQTWKTAHVNVSRKTSSIKSKKHDV